MKSILKLHSNWSFLPHRIVSPRTCTPSQLLNRNHHFSFPFFINNTFLKDNFIQSKRFLSTNTEPKSLLEQSQLLQHLVEEPVPQAPRRARFKITKAIPRIGGLYEDFFIDLFKIHLSRSKWQPLRLCFLRSKDEGILTSEMFEILIMGCMKGKNIQEMTYYWNQMIRSGIKPPQELYHAMIFTYGQFGHLKRAFAYKYQMELAGFKPNVNTFSPILLAAVVAKNYYILFDMVENMDAKEIPVDDSVIYPLAVKIVQDDRDRSFPHRFSVFLNGLFPWNLMLGYYVYAGDEEKIEEASKYLRKEFHSNPLTLGLLILASCQKGNYEKAMELFYFCQDNTITLGVFSYQALLKQASIPNRYIYARQVWKEIASKKINIGPKSLEEFVVRALDYNDLLTAQEILNSVDYSNLVSDNVVKIYYEKNSKKH